MGNTPTKDAQQEMYASYIQQQQDLIFKQQQQINELYKYNLETQQMAPNMLFQQGIVNQNYENGRRMLGSNFQGEMPSTQTQLPQLPPATKPKFDPYKILGISKNYDEKTLKKAYLKAAMKTHPDRGGTQAKFQLVSIAYTLLTKKLKEKDNSHSHQDLRNMSREYTQQQANQPMINTKMTDNFDVDVFNKIYEENKIPEVYDDGYGSWMEKNTNPEIEQKKLFQNGFNKDMFNATFENYKREQAQKNPQNQLVKYQEPEVKISMSNADSIMTLGQGKITDFSGNSDNLAYTDYKQAFTDGSMLIDPSSVDTSGRANSMRGIKSQRSNISYQMTQEDQIRLAKQQALEERAEKDRLSRLNVYDKQHGEAYERIHSMLLR